MKNVLQIFSNDHTSIKVEAVVKKTNDTLLKVQELLEGDSPLFIEIEHQQLNTMLELTKVYPYVLLYLDIKDGILLFKGAAFNLNDSEKPFAISTQFKKILLLHYPLSFTLTEVSHLTVIS